MDENAIAFPKTDQIAEDLGITKAPIRDAIDTLTRRGFLLVRTDPRRRQTIYQRPSAAYTLAVLIGGRLDLDGADNESRLIDGSLIPIHGSRTDEQRDLVAMSDSVVLAGLAKVMSKGAFDMYRLAKEKHKDDSVLREILITDLRNQVGAKTVRTLDSAVQGAPLDLGELTPEQVEIFKRFFPEEHALSEEAEDVAPF
jgi:hypothetical protein